MANADVPLLTFSQLIENPIHPDTGRAVTAEKKMESVQYVLASDQYGLEKNQGNTFVPAAWYSVHTDIRKKENWKLVKEKAEMPE